MIVPYNRTTFERFSRNTSNNNSGLYLVGANGKFLIGKLMFMNKFFDIKKTKHRGARSASERQLKTFTIH